MIEEAGGHLIDYTGKPAELTTTTLIMSNGQPAIDEAIMQTVAEVAARLAERAALTSGSGRSIRAGLMYIDRRYRGRKRRSPWPFVFLLALILVPGVYFLATRTRFFENPFNPLAPTATPTRSAVSYLAEAEDAYKAGLLAKAAAKLWDDARPRAGQLPDAVPGCVAVDLAWASREGRSARAEGGRRRAERGEPCRSWRWHRTGAGSTTTRSRTR